MDESAGPGSAGPGSAGYDSASEETRDGLSGYGVKEESRKSGIHAPPQGAIEKARNFLWEDDDTVPANPVPAHSIDWPVNEGLYTSGSWNKSYSVQHSARTASAARWSSDGNLNADQRSRNITPLSDLQLEPPTQHSADPSYDIPEPVGQSQREKFRAVIEKMATSLRSVAPSRKKPIRVSRDTNNPAFLDEFNVNENDTAIKFSSKPELIDTSYRGRLAEATQKLRKALDSLVFSERNSAHLSHDTNICPRRNSPTFLDDNFKEICDPNDMLSMGDFYWNVTQACHDISRNRKLQNLVILLLTITAVMISTFSLKYFSQTTSSLGGRDSMRYGEIKQLILDSRVSIERDLDTEGSPQFKALNWLVNLDTANLSTENDILLQRYALAVFFYATSGGKENHGKTSTPIPKSSWHDSSNWMTPKGICSWAGIQCHHWGEADRTVYDDNKGVTHLNLTNNNIHGSIPKEIVALSDLRVIDLGQNSIRGSLPDEIGRLQALETLYVSSNAISGTIPSTIGMMSSLTHLFVANTTVEGPLPTTIGKLTALNSLVLYQNHLSGTTIPTELCDLPRLFNLYLDGNGLSGTLPSELGKLSSVSDIRLSLNKLSGSIPTEIGRLSNIESLYFDRNELTGTIPSQIALLVRLDHLQLYNNSLSGSLPTEMGLLRGINFLYLDNNQLYGTIPSNILEGLKNVEHLYMDVNKFTGPIPTTIGSMKNIRKLRLHSNRFTGTIPTQFGLLSRLEKVYLNNNRLAGSLPFEVGNLKHLEKMSIHGNDISGSVPGSVCSLKEKYHLVEFYSDCSGDIPQFQCACCTHCSN